MSEGHNKKECLGAVGMFDGVHRGHAFVLKEVAAIARRRGLKPVIFTFEQHPLAAIRPGSQPGALASAQDKVALIKNISPDIEVVFLPPSVFKLTAREFLEYIHRQYSAEAFAMGYDNHIGSDRATAKDIPSPPIPIIGLDKYPDTAVSSSTIRRAITDGDIALANNLLGRAYSVRGIVEHGNAIGRDLGFPTANIRADKTMLLPAEGVYAVDVVLPDGTTARGMANIGRRPTIAAEGDKTFEVNIFDFSGDVYGKELRVGFLCRLRGEQRFDNLDALRHQLENDKAAAMACHSDLTIF